MNSASCAGSRFRLLRPAILAAGTLNFVRAVESFDTPAIIALPARIEVFTTKIWREALGSFPTNHNLAAAYGVGILGIALVFVYLYRRFTSQVESFSTVTGKGFRPHQIDLGQWRFAASGVALLLLVMLVVLPILVLTLVAILPYYHVPTWQTWQNLTLDHFRYVWATPRVHKAFMNSLFLALVGATACMVLASLASYITVRTKIAGRGIIEGLVFIPWAFPGTAMALGLLWAYVDFPIPIYATIWIILIAYVTRFLPYGLRAVTSTIIQVHKELEEASDRLRRRLSRDFSPRVDPDDAPRRHGRLDHSCDDLHARIQRHFVSLQSRRRAARAAALFSLSRRHARPRRRHRPRDFSHFGYFNSYRAALLALGHN